jgi:parvulin-like peptidyl-prolyl isomerase
MLIASNCSKAQTKPAQSVVNFFHIKDNQKSLVSTISVSEFRQELARARLEREGQLSAGPLSTVLKSAILTQLIDTRILIWNAEQLMVKVSTAAVSKEMNRMEQDLGKKELRKTLIRSYQRSEDLKKAIRERLIIGKLMTDFAHKNVDVTPLEIKTAWDKIPDKDKKVQKLVRAQQIVVQTEEEATEIHTLLRRGHDFAKLARGRSIGPEGKQGGDLGWFEQGVMPKVFDDTCFSLKLGQTSAITPSEYGFHIFQVTGIEPERSLDFEALKDRIRSKILHKKLQAAESSFVFKLRNEFEIVRNNHVIMGIN